MVPPAKKAKLSANQPEEILFDPSARNDYLTGFHKRKVARIEHARETAAKRAREEKVAERRQIREQRRDDLARHVQEVDRELRKMNPDISSDDDDQEDGEDDEENFAGFAPTAERLEQAEDFVDEDKLTTVTVEPMNGDEDDEVDSETAKQYQNSDENKSKQNKAKSKPKIKKKKFRYETKTERKETRMKQKAKNSRAAKARKERQ